MSEKSIIVKLLLCNLCFIIKILVFFAFFSFGIKPTTIKLWLRLWSYLQGTVEKILKRGRHTVNDAPLSWAVTERFCLFIEKFSSCASDRDNASYQCCVTFSFVCFINNSFPEWDGSRVLGLMVWALTDLLGIFLCFLATNYDKTQKVQ